MMRAGEQFNILNKGKVSFDADAFSLLYLPIIGRDAFALYQLLRNFSSGRLMDLLDYLQFGMNDFETALDRLSAISLLDVAQEGDLLAIELRSPLAFEQFLADDFYKNLLGHYIGEQKLQGLTGHVELKGKNLSRKFSAVYPVKFDQPHTPAHSEKFDLFSFKKIMSDRGLQFSDEATDSLTLYSLADKFDKDWFELFHLAAETANEDKTLNTSRMLDRLSDKPNEPSNLSEKQKQILRMAKSFSPQDFLFNLKKQKNTHVTDDERHLLVDLGKYNTPAEVQNILFYYYLGQQQKANINRNSAQALANDWSNQKILTAERALERIANWESQQKEKPGSTSKKQVKKAPDWSNADYVNTTSPEEQAKLEQIRQETLRKMKGGD